MALTSMAGEKARCDLLGIEFDTEWLCDKSNEIAKAAQVLLWTFETEFDRQTTKARYASQRIAEDMPVLMDELEKLNAGKPATVSLSGYHQQLLDAVAALDLLRQQAPGIRLALLNMGATDTRSGE